LAVDSANVGPNAVSDPVWTLSGTTATLVTGTEAGYKLNKGAAVFQKANLNLKTPVATIKGLAKGLKLNNDKICTTSGSGKNITYDDTGISYTTSGNSYEVTLTKAALGTTTVTINNGTFAFGEGVTEPNATNTWNFDNTKGTATYNRSVTTAGYTLSNDKDTITYTASTQTTKNGKPTDKPTDKPTTLITITGLKKGGTLTKTEVNLDTATNVITLNADALNKTKVAIKSGDKNTPYKLALDNDVATSAKDETFWSVNGTKASWIQGKTDFYKVDSKGTSVIYTGAKTTNTYVTLSGIRSNADLTDAIDTTQETITLNAKQLPETTTSLKNGTAVTLALGKDGKTTYKDYKLALDTTNPDTTKKVTEVDYDVAKFGTLNKAGGKATVTREVITSGYELTNDMKITYVEKTAANKKLPVLATLSGVKSMTGVSLNEANKTVNFNDTAMNEGGALTGTTAKITITGTEGYKFVASDITNAAPKVEAATTLKDATNTGVGTFTGKVKDDGYLFSDENTLLYVKNTTKEGTLATVKGLVASAKNWADFSDRTLTLKANLATGSKATLDGTGVIAFNLGETYSNASIAGGAKDDTITAAGNNISIGTAAGNDSINVTGSNVSVNAGKGNDFIDLGTNSATVFYASGDGNDVIANFTANPDKLIVTKGTVNTVEADGDDLVVTIDKKSFITLKGAASSDSFTIYTGSSGTNKAYEYEKPAAADLAASADLLYDTNYADGSDLGDIVNGSDNGLLTGDLSNPTDATSLTNQTPTATYGSKK
jgi:hypothetical protein